MTRYSVVALAAILWTAGLAAGVAHASGTPSARAAAKDVYVLGLGDSLPFGFDVARYTTGHIDPAVDFADGFVDQTTTMLRTMRPARSISLTNYSCPGETTASLLAGPCAYAAFGLPLHDAYAGSQMAAAEAFLAAHPGPGVILVNVGANDPGDFTPECQQLADPNPCLLAAYPALAPEIHARIRTNLTTIIQRLRVAAPKARILVWNTYALDDTDPQTAVLLHDVNGAIREAVTRSHARATLLDATRIVTSSTLCALTSWCEGGGDSHLTPAGHERYARRIVRALRHARLR